MGNDFNGRHYVGLSAISLFSGAGGFDIAAKLSGIKTICYVENDRFAQGVLMSRIRDGRIDNAPIWDDIRSFDGKPWHGRVDCVFGGFPCQPHSMVGKRRGGSDDRNLWPDFLRIVRECRPGFILGENVEGICSTYAREILADMEEIGYCAEPVKISACEVGAPHMRARVFFLAHTKGISRGKTNQASDKDGGMQRAWMGNISRSWKEMASLDWAIPPCWVLRDIDGLAFRVDRARLTGNGVVPQQATPVFEKIVRMAAGLA